LDRIERNRSYIYRDENNLFDVIDAIDKRENGFDDEVPVVHDQLAQVQQRNRHVMVVNLTNLNTFDHENFKDKIDKCHR